MKTTADELKIEIERATHYRNAWQDAAQSNAELIAAMSELI